MGWKDSSSRRTSSWFLPAADARGELEFVFAERVDDAWAAAIPQLAERLAEAEAA